MQKWSGALGRRVARSAVLCFRGHQTNNSNYTSTAIWCHWLCAQTSSHLPRWEFTVTFQMATKWRTAITVKCQVANKALVAHKHGLCLHFTALHKASYKVTSKFAHPYRCVHRGWLNRSAVPRNSWRSLSLPSCYIHIKGSLLQRPLEHLEFYAIVWEVANRWKSN